MRYIICDDCGGYYKLLDGESLEDFDACRCGGHLRYAQSFKEIIKNRDAPTKTCIHCGASNSETALICSKCGKQLRRVNRRVKDYPARKSNRSNVNILDRISFMGVIAGIIFLVVASIIAVIGLAGSIMSNNGVDVLRSMGGYLILFVFVIIASGFISSYISGTKDYVDGLLNGAMVGLALSVLGALFTMIMVMTVDVGMGIAAGLITLLAYVLIYGSLTAFGGLIGAWLRNNMEN
jgi:ribosomal protein L40E